MKRNILLLIVSGILILFITSFAAAVDYPPEWDGWEEAEETVKNLPCSEGGTVDQYLTRKAAIPAVEDLGWTTSSWKDGFYVERLLLLDQTMPMRYRWHVDLKGKVKPVNGKAMGIAVGGYAEAELYTERSKEAVVIPPQQYEIGYTVSLRNRSDTTVTVYKDSALSNVTNVFTNGISALVVGSKKHPDKLTMYKVQIILKDGTEYTGWISGNSISN